MTKEELEKEVEDKGIKYAEPREKQIAELELKIKHLTEHLEPQAMTSLFEQVEEEVKQEQKIKTLERENAELKEQNRSLLESCEGATMMYKDLCKAKKIIKCIVDTPMYNQIGGEMYENEEYEKFIVEADQFLKECK